MQRTTELNLEGRLEWSYPGYKASTRQDTTEKVSAKMCEKAAQLSASSEVALVDKHSRLTRNPRIEIPS